MYFYFVLLLIEPVLILVYSLLSILKADFNNIRKQRRSTQIITVKESPSGKTCYLCGESFIEIPDNVAQCPHCSNYFHYKHLTVLLKIKPNCSVCDNKIKV